MSNVANLTKGEDMTDKLNLKKGEVLEIGAGGFIDGRINAENEPIVIMTKSTFEEKIKSSQTE